MSEPAYDIPLDETALNLIGELCAIQGMIEYDMQKIVRKLEGISPDDARERLSADGMRKIPRYSSAPCEQNARTPI